MRTLVVHPRDISTGFLKDIYSKIKDKTVVWGGINKTQLRKLIEDHDRVLFMGHGSPSGLLAVGQFHMAGNYIIDYSIVDLLTKKTQVIYIWCHANLFVQRYGLQGFCCGMFISEISEAKCWGFEYPDPYLIEESNIYFSEIVGKNINKPIKELYRNVIQEYGILAKTNQIAKFNLERLCLNVNTLNMNLCYQGIP